jgi:hypothetical protein
MNAQQYANYEANVASFLKRNAVKPGCHGPTLDQAEPFFSCRHCECWPGVSMYCSGVLPSALSCASGPLATRRVSRSRGRPAFSPRILLGLRDAPELARPYSRHRPHLAGLPILDSDVLLLGLAVLDPLRLPSLAVLLGVEVCVFSGLRVLNRPVACHLFFLGSAYWASPYRYAYDTKPLRYCNIIRKVFSLAPDARTIQCSEPRFWAVFESFS